MKPLHVVREKPLGAALILGLVVCGLLGCNGGSSSTSISRTPAAITAATAPPPSAFPLVVSRSQRYLQDQNGVPVPILGRSAWFITSLSEADYKTFIDDSLAKGFNAIEFHVINHDARGRRPPFGGNGALPFTARLDGTAWIGLLSYANINFEDRKSVV